MYWPLHNPSENLTPLVMWYYTPIAKCIDHYTTLHVKKFETGLDEEETDVHLESIVNRMFERCFDEGRYQQAAGIALETRRIDLLERAILESVSDRQTYMYTCI